MPTLTIIAACEKVIFDRVGIASLINIFQRLNITVADTEVPENAVAPLKWCVYTQWRHEPATAGKSYVQRVRVITPAGETFVEGSLPFTIESDTDPYTKHGFDIFGLPMAKEGEFKIQVWLEDVSNATGEYVMRLDHLRGTQGQAEPNSKVH